MNINAQSQLSNHQRGNYHNTQLFEISENVLLESLSHDLEDSNEELHDPVEIIKTSLPECQTFDAPSGDQDGLHRVPNDSMISLPH